MPSGIYNVTVTATSGNASDSVVLGLSIGLADPLTVSFSVSDGSSPSEPTMTYVYDGIYNQIILSTTPQIIYVDNGSSWNISSSLNVSSTQRWIAESATQGMAAGPSQIDVKYFHQYLVSFTVNSS